jgi:MYXO-CTERM domain-containing protein
VGLLMCVPSTALAQPTLAPVTEIEAAQAEVDRDYAQALAADCSLACRALDSMRRAAERLCVLDPGDRCTSAKKKLDEATTRVRTACPACPEALTQEKQAGAPPSPAPAVTGMTAVENESVQRKGGCAGCATSSAPSDAIAPLALAGLVALALRRRRR